MEPAHTPVMLRETLEWLNIRPDGIYADATAGLGGHTGAIAQRLTTGLVIASDCDAESLEIARRNTAPWADRIRFRHGWFSTLAADLVAMGIPKVDGLTADLGASFYQLRSKERGFSIQAGGPLDMRYDRGASVTPGHFINLNEKELVELVRRQGEERVKAPG